jgi:hypothetical protein
MALTSPGVEVTIIDESQYVPAATNSVPYVLLVTAQNKISGAGVGVAAGTLKVNANKVYLIDSQRDLAATFGVPFFYKTTTGTPINGYELNEYGLLAAYSALGISNRCYVQRADIDLTELTASLTRPTGEPDDGTYWLDTANSLYGLFQWNQTTAAFANSVPRVITNTDDLQINTTVPLQSIGNIGDYSVVSTSIYNPIYFKRGGPTTAQAPGWFQDGFTADQLYNSWVLLGSDLWKTSWPTVSGTATATTVPNGSAIIINGTVIAARSAPANTVLNLVDDINNAAIDGVHAAYISNRLFLYASGLATGDGSSEGGIGVISIANSSGTPLTTLGITAGDYAAPTFYHAPSYQVPRWRTTDETPEPTGSVWMKTNSVNLGLNLVLKRYNSTLGAFVQQACPEYNTRGAATYGLDPSGGGKNIPAGTVFVEADAYNDSTATLQLFERFASGPTIVTGDTTTPGPFVPGDSMGIVATSVGTATNNVGTATIGGTGTVADFVAAISAANIPYVSATVNSSGAIVLTHSAGGVITIASQVGNPMAAAGFNTSVRGVEPLYTNGVVTGLVISNWVFAPTWTYTASNTAPDQDPATGTYWYYSATDQVDIMIQNNGSWFGYQNVTNDVRGYNLSLTNATGPIISATPPTTQTDESQSPLVYGDLWISTADLENYPLLYRWQSVNGQNQWVLLSNSDQTTENGVLFTDARWSIDSASDPITDPLPSIQGLLTSNWIDIDGPDPTLYPQGMLLWNTRRSGFNVKSFQANYFTAENFPDWDAPFPPVTSTWLTASGNRLDGSPYMGRHAQRALIVAALKSGIDTSTAAREEQRVFNLAACPQYPELLPNLIALNNERNNTAFIVGDTPLRLTPDEIITWATNADGEGLPTADGLVAGDQYSGVFYPSCTTTDLSGSVVVQPPSHMMLRTIIRSDEQAYPWLAPAGTRRGVVDNATQIGYITAATGEFESIGVRQGLRDTLYENRINPITFVPGVGITNFGNKTTTSVVSAMDRINVSRLVAFIRGRLESIAKQFLFEPNDQITRNEITNAITSLMIDLVAKRGIYDYLVVCDLSNNTPARIDRNELYVDVAIEPVKAVEFIYIPVRIKNTGEISGTAV